MRYTTNYNMVIGEGTDAVNPLTQIFPNFETIDAAMESNKEHGITTASEVTTGSVHAITRVDSSVDIFRFTATSAWTTGDTMTLDGSAVTVHLSDGTAPLSGAYIIGAEVVGVVVGSLVTLLTSSTFDGVKSFNSRNGVVLPQSGDYTANQIGYNNTGSGLAATNVQDAVDEISGNVNHGIFELWTNVDPSQAFAPQTINITVDKTYDTLFVEMGQQTSAPYPHGLSSCEVGGHAYSEYFGITGSGHVLRTLREIVASRVADTLSVDIGAANITELATWGSPVNTTDNTKLIPLRIFGVVHNS